MFPPLKKEKLLIKYPLWFQWQKWINNNFISYLKSVAISHLKLLFNHIHSIWNHNFLCQKNMSLNYTLYNWIALYCIAPPPIFQHVCYLVIKFMTFAEQTLCFSNLATGTLPVRFPSSLKIKAFNGLLKIRYLHS